MANFNKNAFEVSKQKRDQKKEVAKHDAFETILQKKNIEVKLLQEANEEANEMIKQKRISSGHRDS